MSTKKDRRKARRRAEKLMEEAWEAFRDDNSTRAERTSRRAIDLGFVNPRLWLDRARILDGIGNRNDAEEAARRAIAIAPTYAEAFELLADLVARTGRLAKARELLLRAVELGADERAHDTLASYEAVLGTDVVHKEREDAPPEYTARTERYDWSQIDEELDAHGAARLDALLSAEECAALHELWDDDEHFEHRVQLDDESGFVEYRFLAHPLPRLVVDVRAEIYARAATIANRWNALLGRGERFPHVHDRYLEQCRVAGQTRSTPILLRYEQGGFNAPHRDIAGRLVFPLQLAVTLGPASSRDSASGGEFVLVDQRPGKRPRRRTVSTGVGDAVLFCTRERLVRVGGYPGLMPVAHGVRALTEGVRFAFGMPFHEHG